MKFLILLLILKVAICLSDNCTECLANGKIFCASDNLCDSKSCKVNITQDLNCPQLPLAEYAYEDAYARRQILPITAAAGLDDPTPCFVNQIPTMSVYSTISVNCSAHGPETNCFGFTAVDKTQKVIVFSFRGAKGKDQIEYMNEELKKGTVDFFNIGKIVKIGYDSFMYLWNGGLQADARALKFLYPDYEVWINGHSLGSMLAAVTASYVVKIGLFKPEQIKLMTMGQPRIGDYDFAEWHANTFPYSYRINSHRDPVPHEPSSASSGLFHYRTEIWYPNSGADGEPYEVCAEADGPYCSNKIVSWDFDDHLWYFGIQFVDWGYAGCPKNSSSFGKK